MVREPLAFSPLQEIPQVLNAVPKQTMAQGYRVDRKDFADFLKMAKLASTFLNGVILQGRDGRLCAHVGGRLVTSYLDLGEGENSPPILAPFNELAEALRVMTDTHVTLAWDYQFLTVTGAKSRRKIAVTDDINFLTMPRGIPTYPFPVAPILEALPAILKIVKPDSPRNYGTVVHLSVDPRLHVSFVGTDGFRLAYSKHETPIGMSKLDQVNLPYYGAMTLLALARQVATGGKPGEVLRLGVSEDQATLVASSDTATVFIRTSAVKYPNYQGVIPKARSGGHSFIVKEFLPVVRQALQSSDKSCAMRILAGDEGQMIVQAKAHKDAPASEFRHDLPGGCFSLPYAMACNARFLVDVLTPTKAKVGIMTFGEDNDTPFTITLGNVTSVLVPIKEAD